MLALNESAWKRFFSVPCALVDNYIKLADGPALKLILYLLSSEEQPEENKILSVTGISKQQLDEAVMFWKELGVIVCNENDSVDSPKMENSSVVRSVPVAKVVHTRYQPKDIADRLRESPGLKQMFKEAETTLHRILNHADHETLMCLKDSFGFGESSIILILQYCYELGKTSARYYEKVAENLFENGITKFEDIEQEFDRLKTLHSFENEAKNALGLDIKLTPKQKQFIATWKEMGFGIDMIKLAREKCVDATNKLSFPYIDKILHSWEEKGISDPEAAINEQKPERNNSKERSFDIDEFDRFTLGESGEKV